MSKRVNIPPHHMVRLFHGAHHRSRFDFGFGPETRQQRQSRREKTGNGYGVPSVANALCAHGCGRLRRQRIDDTGKSKSLNLRGWR